MPQNTPMKRQFTTIDGRTVMSNLPQHWGGNDWTITGVDNPLPVGNYVQTEAGVWIPQKGSDDGAADVRLTGSIVKKEVILGRGIRSSDTSVINRTTPSGAKGAIVTANLYGATGAFESDQGLSINLIPYTDEGNGIGVITTPKSNVSGRGFMIFWALGTVVENNQVNLPRATFVGMLLPPRIGFQLNISGTFEVGEGMDCDLKVTWVF